MGSMTTARRRMAATLGVWATLSCGGTRSGDREPSSAQGAPTAEDPLASGKVPADVAVLLDAANQPCTPHLRVPLAQHKLDVSSRGGQRETAFMLEVRERLCLVGDRSPTGLTNVHLVDDASVLARSGGETISVELATVGIGTVLVVKNPFDAPLRYRAIIHRAENNQAKPTSVCPVQARLVGLEHWPDALDIVTVGDFQLLQPDEPLDCR